jgi:uncharacterized protein YjiS (DUF1127 family)
MSAVVAKRTARMTIVALIPDAGIVLKHARDRFSPSTNLREKSMSVTKRLPHARSQSRRKRPLRTDWRSFAEVHINDDEKARARSRQGSPSPQSVVAAASIARPSTFRTAARFAESAGDILLNVAWWMLLEIVNGFICYVMVMHGIPTDPVGDESGDSDPFASQDPSTSSSRPVLRIIAAKTDGRIRAHEAVSTPGAALSCADAKHSARSEPAPGERSRWRTAIIAPTVQLLAKIRERNGRRRAVAELQSLDDRSLRDIGISRGDIGYIARHGARPE